ncbi:uncharacterized protein LTR77_010849 [Saxophila tyrrhenica]|uniref:Uncharacterized protein n=1 Tax=Saxophila tyrrhenica TaxID=1690608 RepID=A0AAV9NUX6_9PEZI|nr:hypothetical protein LTR77_010849 [Saxophila tyrrhenica]
MPFVEKVKSAFGRGEVNPDAQIAAAHAAGGSDRAGAVQANARRYEKLWEAYQNLGEIIQVRNQEIADANQRIRNIKDQHQQTLASLQSYHDQEVTQLNENLRKREEESDQAIYQARSDHRQEVDRLKQKHGTDRADLIQHHTEVVDRMKRQHEQETQSLDKNVRELKGALLKRDDGVYQAKVFTPSGIPNKPDDKIRSQFSEVQQIVDNLSRMSWKPDQSVWNGELLETISVRHGQRLVCKVILQDLIWYVLPEATDHLAIQDSPEPSSNESYNWPAPGIKAERWRYFTMKECREILPQKALSAYDRRGLLKTGFITSVESLATEMRSELSNVADFTDSHQQLVKSLSVEAATTWLDFETYRCRIMVRLTGSAISSAEEKVAQAKEGMLTFTRLPSVGRYGTVEGVELENFTTINGCGGETLTVP